MKLIDVDALLNNTDGVESDHVKYSQEYGHVVLVCDIVYAPTVDAVVVVRCKDCKWYDTFHPYGTVMPDAFHCKMNDRFYDTHHYCAYGERRN